MPRGGGGNRSGDAGGGREHFFVSAGHDGVTPRRASTLTTSTIGKRIESLFLSSFLRRATTTAGATTRTKEERGTMSGSSQVCRYNNDEYNDDNDNYCVATIFDGGILVVLFPDNAKMATFQGRKSESGNGMHDIPELTLSWEYCRCQCNAAQRHVQRNANNIDDDLNDDEDDDNSGGGGVWDLLPT